MELPINQIVTGDCLEVMKGWPDGCVDLVLTDPPYKVSQKYGGGVDADNLTAVSSIMRTLPELSRVLRPDRFMVVCYDNRILPFLFEAIKGTPLVYRKQLFIYRRWGCANRWVGWMQTTDPVCVFVNGYNKPFSPSIRGQVKHDCYVKTGPEEYNAGHPAQKPLDFMQDCVTWLSDESEVVLDPYCGSGTSMYAAAALGRRWIGIEKDAGYAETARERLRAVDTGVSVKDARAGQMALWE